MHALGVRLEDEDYNLLFDEYDMDSSGEVWSHIRNHHGHTSQTAKGVQS